MPRISIEKSRGLSVAQKESAKATDQIVEKIFASGGVGDASLHGGLAGWRCYNSGRYSADADLYSMQPEIKGSLEPLLGQVGLVFRNFRDTGNVIFATVVQIGSKKIEVGLEFMRQPMPAGTIITDYTKYDGSTMSILALSPYALAKEKITAYGKRKEIRDIYDVFHLCTRVMVKEDDPAAREGFVSDSSLKSELTHLLNHLDQPVNESDLGKRLYGVKSPPSFDHMARALIKLTRE